MAVELYVRPAHFTWLITTTLDVAHQTDLDFSFPEFSRLTPRDGFLPLDGPGAEAAKAEIRFRLGDLGIVLSETSLKGL